MAEHKHTKKARGLLNRTGYKAGGHVKDDVKKGVHEHEAHMHKGKKKTKIKLAEGGHAHGEKPKHRSDKLARGGKAKGKGGHGKVTVNVINAHGGAKPPMAMKPPPMMPPPGAGPGGPPPGGPPMPPPGGPPMNRGGRARSRGGKASDSQRDDKGGMPKGHFRKGGRPHMTAGAGSGVGRLEKAAAEAKRPGGKR